MKKIFILIILCSNIFYAQQGQWEVVDEMPWPVANADACVDNGNIYIVGGYSDSTQGNVNWILKYNSYIKLWKHISQMNFKRIGLVAGRTIDSAYYLGGVIDTTANTETMESWGFSDAPVISNYNLQFDRTNATGLINNDNFYIIGGNPSISRSSNIPYIIEYNVTSRNITYSSDTLFTDGTLPEQQMSVLQGSDILIFGGVLNGISQKIYKFNTISHSFEILPLNLLTPRAAGRAVYVPETGEIYIIGGYNEQDAALSSVEILKRNGNSYTIEKGPSLNYPRKNFVAADINGAIYVIGGYDESDNVIPQVEKLFATITNIVEDNKNVINDFKLEQNYPNPFNPSTRIDFSVNKKSFLNLEIFNIQGEHIRSLTKGVYLKGDYNLNWDGKNDKGISVPSGVYLYRLSTDQFNDVKKMILLR